MVTYFKTPTLCSHANVWILRKNLVYSIHTVKIKCWITVPRLVMESAKFSEPKLAILLYFQCSSITSDSKICIVYASLLSNIRYSERSRCSEFWDNRAISQSSDDWGNEYPQEKYWLESWTGHLFLQAIGVFVAFTKNLEKVCQIVNLPKLFIWADAVIWIP